MMNICLLVKVWKTLTIMTISGKVAFKLVKGFKNKDYEDGSGGMGWRRLKGKLEPLYALSLVKLEEKSVNYH
jgi:hypothetical protein